MKTKTVPLILSGAGVAAAAAVSALYRYVFCRSYLPVTGLLLDKKGHTEEYYSYRRKMTAYMENRPHTEHVITSAGGQLLHGYYYQAGDKPSRVIVFIVHGYRSEHNETAACFYDYYMSRGIDLFTCDHAAHGESSGEVIGYGVTEARDCFQWLSYLLDTFGSDVRLILHGFSMGAATVMLMSDRVPENVRFIVEDSGYTSAEEILSPSLGSSLKFYSRVNRLVGGYDLSDSDVRPHLLHTRTPFLFVHGKEDRFVPFAMAPELFKLCPSEKDRLYVPEARHIESIYVAPEAYKAKLDEYLLRYL